MWGQVAGAAIGAVAGSQGSKTSQDWTSGIRVAPETALEKQATGTLAGGLSGVESVVNAGPGAQAATDYMKNTGSLQDMLKSYAAGGNMPTQADMASAGKYASDVFKPQQVMQDQQFQQQQQMAQRLAAQLNRPVNDPIIQAKLGQEQMRQNQQLAAQQTSFGAQYAQQMPMQRLGFTQQLADVSGNLASQAMSNRQALLSMGSTLREQDRSYRINTGERYGSQSSSSGGGLQGALSGAIAGAGSMGAGLEALGGGISSFFKPAPAGATTATSNMNEFNDLATQRATGNVSQSNLSAGGGGYSGGGMPQQPSPYAGQQTSYGVPSFLNPNTGYSGGGQQQSQLMSPNYNPLQQAMSYYGVRK